MKKSRILLIALACSAFLTACSTDKAVETSTGSETSTASVTAETTVVTIEETTTAEIETVDFPIDNLNMPDGISTPKTDAVSYQNGFLEFDFAFIRAGEAFFRDSRFYPDEFDLSKSNYIGSIMEETKTEYIRLSAGDTYGDLTVKKATSLVFPVNKKSESGETYKDIGFNTCEVEFEGTVKLKGILYCAPADNGGDVLIFPYSNEANTTLIPYSSLTTVSPGQWCSNSGDFALYGDINSINVGDINEIDLDLTSHFKDSNYLPVEITLTNPVVLYSEDTGGNRSYGTLVSVDFLD